MKSGEPRKSEMTFSELSAEIKQDSEGFYSQTIRYKIGFETREWLLQTQQKDEREAREFAEIMRKKGCNVAVMQKQDCFLVYVDYRPTHGKEAAKLVEGVELR